MRNSEKGQAIMLVVLALGIFLMGGMGLAIDGAQIYAHREMAQAAADAAAQAGAMDIYNGTNVQNPFGLVLDNRFGSAQHVCTTTDVITPCRYAALNGFGTTASDTVTVDFPASTTAPAGVSLSGSDPVNFVKVTVSRNVDTTLMRLLGAASFATVRVSATAAIVDSVSPVPIVVTHPTLANVLDTGTGSITIVGGPQRSIQVNSSNANAISNPNVDLTAAGPFGTGGDMGVFGRPSTKPSSVKLGTTGHYVQPASPIRDPLAFVTPPAQPATAGAVTNNGCGSGCDLYGPGLYNGGLNLKNTTAQFKPGVYYVKNGDFSLKNTTATMCSTCTADANTGRGMLVYHTGTGSFDINTGVDNTLLLGAGVSTATPPTAPTGPYYGILFFQDRTAPRTDHGIGQGNGCFTLQGTLYMTNTLDIMIATPTQYQSISYNGNPCSTTAVQGEIITGALSMVGKKDVINMSLYPQGFLHVRQVALVQ